MVQTHSARLVAPAPDALAAGHLVHVLPPAARKELAAQVDATVNVTVSIDMSPKCLLLRMPLKRTRVVPDGRLTAPDESHAARDDCCCPLLVLTDFQVEPSVLASTESAPMVPPYMVVEADGSGARDLGRGEVAGVAAAAAGGLEEHEVGAALRLGRASS